MATGNGFKLYDHPRFGLIVGLFLLSIVVILIAGVTFFHLHTPTAKAPHRTGMVLLLKS